MNIIKKSLILQSVLLVGGTVFAWSKLIPQFSEFIAIYGTAFRFRDCAIPNPLTTACFYGSVAFVVALIWSLKLLRKPDYTSERYLRNFLLFGVCFAASVVSYEFADYYKLFSSEVTISCSPGVLPFKTPCFTGMLFFIASFITAVFATRRLALVGGKIA